MRATARLEAPPIVLDATAASACPVKTRHAYAAGRSAAVDDDRPLDPVPDERERDRSAFVQGILDRWLDERLAGTDLRGVSDPGERTRLTHLLMRTGTDLIVAPGLAPEASSSRGGSPDALIRSDDDDRAPRYSPVLVRWHKVLFHPKPDAVDPEPSRPLLGSPADPRIQAAEPTDLGLRLQTRLADFLQLAHYYRLLQSAGFAGGGWGAVIGTDRPPDTPLLTWVALDRPMVRVVDHELARGWRMTSLLDHADVELARRVAIAAEVRSPGTRPADVVRPVVIEECRTCPWWPACRAELDPDDLSLRIARGRLDRIEVSALRARGVTTVADLAAADVDSVLAAYLPEVAHRADAERRLLAIARRARMLERGEPIERETSGPISVPGAAVEIDLDIETAASGRIYLWGFEVTTGGGSRYVEFSRFADLSEAEEAALARIALGWLRRQIGGPRSVRVFHYSGFEVAMIEALAARSPDDEVLVWAAAYARAEFVDLLGIVQTHFFGAAGLGLKQIAVTAGFGWRDPDPGGLNSQRWFDEAVHAADPVTREAAQRRVLAYNEDDVRATAHLRSWLRAR